MILEGSRLCRIEGILAEMTRGSDDEANVRKDVAAFLKVLRRTKDGRAELHADSGAIKLLASLIEGRLSAIGSRIDIPASVKSFRSSPETFMNHLMSMNPATLVARGGLSREASLLSQENFALGLVLLELLEEKTTAQEHKEVKEARPPKKPKQTGPGVSPKRGRPPKRAASGKADISALKPMHHHPAPFSSAPYGMRLGIAGMQPPMLSGLTFCRII